MIQYHVGAYAKAEFSKDIRLVQGAIAAIANSGFSLGSPPKGIFKYEGGVVVNNREIAIKKDILVDDWSHKIDPSPEEIAVFYAIATVARKVEHGGIEALIDYSPCDYGDPLRMLIST